MLQVDSPRRRPSAALVVAILALFLAIGGTGYAALRLPKNSVGTRQIRAHAVTAEKVEAGAGVSLSYTRATQAATIAANSIAGEYVPCPIGFYAVGGGGYSVGPQPGVYLDMSVPYNSVGTNNYSGVANAWAVDVDNTTSQPQQMQVYVVCAAAATTKSSYVKPFIAK